MTLSCSCGLSSHGMLFWSHCDKFPPNEAVVVAGFRDVFGCSILLFILPCDTRYAARTAKGFNQQKSLPEPLLATFLSSVRPSREGQPTQFKVHLWQKITQSSKHQDSGRGQIKFQDLSREKKDNGKTDCRCRSLTKMSFFWLNRQKSNLRVETWVGALSRFVFLFLVRCWQSSWRKRSLGKISNVSWEDVSIVLKGKAETGIIGC